MEKARCNTELYSDPNLRTHLENVKPATKRGINVAAPSIFRDLATNHGVFVAGRLGNFFSIALYLHN